jgi:hypothetical protein
LKVAALLLLITPAVQAGSVKERMKARAPEILKLKTQGLVGENNQGYLEVRAAANGNAASLVKAENQDRRMVYEAIAAKTGGSVEQVGQRAAAQRAERAGGGEWVQTPSGKWVQK